MGSIKIFSDTSLVLDSTPLVEFLSTIGYNKDIGISDLFISGESSIGIHSMCLSELVSLLKNKVVDNSLHEVSFKTDSTLSIPIYKFNSIITDHLNSNPIEYIKEIQIVSTESNNIKIAIKTKLGISFTVDVNKEITLDKNLRLSINVISGSKILLKVVSIISKLYGKERSISYTDDVISVDLRDILDLSNDVVDILEKWLSKIEGTLFYDKGYLKLGVIAST